MNARRSYLKRSTKPIPRSRIKRRSRKPSKTRRIYGPPARREFVKTLPCAACGVVGYSENAHVPPVGEAGTGYKAGYRFIAPLCGERWSEDGEAFLIGCHTLHDEHHWSFVLDYPAFDPVRAAAETENLWLAHLRGENSE